MTRFRRPKFNSERGSSLLVVLMLVMLISVGSTVLLFLREQNLRMTYMGQRTAITLSVAKSGLDTFMLAWKNVEAQYFRDMAGCDVANGLIAALAMGNGCAGKTVTVMKGNTPDPLAGPDTYSYRATSSGCSIAATTSTCPAFTSVFLEMGVGQPAQTEGLGRYKLEFALLHAMPLSHLAEFRLTMTSPDGMVTRYDFALQDVIQSVAHLEGSGRVVQEKGDPFSLCPSPAWGPLQTFDVTQQKCKDFDQAASGTGLASYKDRFFGFQPSTGQIVDLLSLAAGGAPSTFIVQPNGTVAGLGQVFVPYPAPGDLAFSLANADDITLIDQQIYYVRGGPNDVDLRMLVNNGGAWTDTKICDLGALGWSQSAAGLAATGISDPLGRTPGDPLSDAMVNRSAVFFLKTDSGDLITVRVASAVANNYACQVYRDSSLQQVEYKRTLGFEGASTQANYFIY